MAESLVQHPVSPLHISLISLRRCLRVVSLPQISSDALEVRFGSSPLVDRQMAVRLEPELSEVLRGPAELRSETVVRDRLGLRL